MGARGCQVSRYGVAIVLALALLAAGGCGWRQWLGLPDAPAAPAPQVPPGGLPPAPPPGPESTPEDREAFYRDQVEALSMKLEAAKVGLKVARQDAADAEAKSWQQWTRWVGLAGVVIAVGLGGALTWAIGPRIGLPVGGIVAAMALAVVGYGAAVRWLPLVLGGSVIAGGLVWLLYHLRHRLVAERASRVVDALEREGSHVVREAKQALGAAVERSGLKGRLDRLRGGTRGRRTWGNTSSSSDFLPHSDRVAKP